MKLNLWPVHISSPGKRNGKSKRTTERKTAIGEKLGDIYGQIKAADIEDSQTVTN